MHALTPKWNRNLTDKTPWVYLDHFILIFLFRSLPCNLEKKTSTLSNCQSFKHLVKQGFEWPPHLDHPKCLPPKLFLMMLRQRRMGKTYYRVCLYITYLSKTSPSSYFPTQRILYQFPFVYDVLILIPHFTKTLTPSSSLYFLNDLFSKKFLLWSISNTIFVGKTNCVKNDIKGYSTKSHSFMMFLYSSLTSQEL